MIRLCTLARLTAAVALLLALPSQAVPYIAVDLGAPLQGNSQANGLNNTGQVVGSIDAEGASTAAVWSGNSVTRLNPLDGDNSSSAQGINDAGQVAGVSWRTTIGDTQAVTWNGSTAIGLPPGRFDPGSYTFAYDINNRRQVAGLGNYPEFQFGTAATIWNAGVRTVIGSVGSRSEARAINNQGQVAGLSQHNFMGTEHATLWNDGVASNLSAPGYWSAAFDINDAGQVVGESAPNERDPRRPTLWEGGNTIGLDTLGGNSGVALSVNETGQIVGSATGADNVSRAALWEGGSVIDLNVYLDPSLVSAGWVLTSASGINDEGYIAVNATHSGTGTYHAFLLSPVPEPGVPAMLLGGLALLGWTKGRRRPNGPSSMDKVSPPVPPQ